MKALNTYAECAQHQLDEWVAGRPWHNPLSPLGPEHEGLGGGECCPDFSCCRPGMLWSKARREAFVAASGSDRRKMMRGALSTLIEDQ